MFLKDLYIVNIRNIRQEKICFNSNTVFLSGKNGQGKTSILEAIFMLSHVRSFRSKILSEILTLETGEGPAKEAAIKGTIETKLGKIELEILLKQKKRELYLNNKKIENIDQFCGKLKTVLFTPEDLEIVKGGPVIRRQFLDRIIVMLRPMDIHLLNDYSKVLKFRNKLLKDKKATESRLLLPKLIKLNLEIVKRRLELVENLRDKVKIYYPRISGINGLDEKTKENLELSYSSSFVKETNTKELKIISEEEILNLFKENEQKELILNRTILGSHKDELKIDFIINGSKSLSRATSSQGQIRTKVLSFKLASAEIIHSATNEWPILLLDDVESELDEERINNLRKEILKYPGQVFITGINAKISLKKEEKEQIFELKKGQITELF